MNLPNLKKAKERTKNKVEYKENPMIESNSFLGKKYFLRTYGCQMNEHDGEQIEAILEHLGMSPCEDLESAQVIVLNTCAIRENAHDKVFGYLGRIKHLKKEHPDVIVCIGGCMSQEEGVVNELLHRHPYVNIVFGTHNIHELGSMLLEAKKDHQDIEVYSKEGEIYEHEEINSPFPGCDTGGRRFGQLRERFGAFFGSIFRIFHYIGTGQRIQRGKLRRIQCGGIRKLSGRGILPKRIRGTFRGILCFFGHRFQAFQRRFFRFLQACGIQTAVQAVLTAPCGKLGTGAAPCPVC